MGDSRTDPGGVEEGGSEDAPFSIEAADKGACIARVGRYAVYGAIGSGGMASVHLGKLRGAGGFGRVVAIKRLHANFAASEEFAARFVEEAQVASRVQHPNVVTIIDAVARDGELLLVMDHVLGESLATLASSGKEPIPVATAVAIVVDVLRGLGAAHAATDEGGEPLALVHRDVSPQNVLVGVDGVARLLDFGIAKVARGRGPVTEEGVVKGKVAYMAPEQLYGEPVDQRTDVYAVGVLLWELLTGRRLFAGDGCGSTATQVLDRPVARPRVLAGNIPPALDRVVMRAIERDAEARYPDASAMEVALLEAFTPAPPAEVGQVVEARCAEALGARRRLLQHIEGLSNEGDEVPPTVPSRPPTENPARGVPWLLVAATAVAALVVGRLAAFPPSSSLRASSPPSASRPAVPATPPSVSPVVPPALTATKTQTPPAPEPAPPSDASARGKVLRARSRSAPPAPPAARCDPAFIIDERGHKKYKPECL